VLGELPVAALDFRIVEGGVHDRGPEIVEDDAARLAPEEVEGGAVQPQPGVHRLVEHQLGVLMPAARERHHEDPRPPHPAAVGIEEQAGEAEVHLRLRAGVDLQPQRAAGLGRAQPPQEALDRGVAAVEAVLIKEQLPDRLALDAAVVQGLHPLTKRLDERVLMRGAVAGRRLEQGGQGGRVRQGSLQQPLSRGPLPVPGDRIAPDAEVAGDAPVGLAELETSHDLANIGHRTPPSSHRHPREQEVDPCRRSMGDGLES